MNIGDLQRKLSLWATQDKERKFHDLYTLVCREDWLRLAYEHVRQNAGSQTAGCDDVNMSAWETDLEGNLARLRMALRSEEFAACPARRVYIPKTHGKRRPLGIPMCAAYCTSEQEPWGKDPTENASAWFWGRNHSHGTFPSPGL
jgi:retron-type reverse transcriptase